MGIFDTAAPVHSSMPSVRKHAHFSDGHRDCHQAVALVHRVQSERGHKMLEINSSSLQLCQTVPQWIHSHSWAKKKTESSRNPRKAMSCFGVITHFFHVHHKNRWMVVWHDARALRSPSGCVPTVGGHRRMPTSVSGWIFYTLNLNYVGAEELNSESLTLAWVSFRDAEERLVCGKTPRLKSACRAAACKTEL